MIIESDYIEDDGRQVSYEAGTIIPQYTEIFKAQIVKK